MLLKRIKEKYPNKKSRGTKKIKKKEKKIRLDIGIVFFYFLD